MLIKFDDTEIPLNHLECPLTLRLTTRVVDPSLHHPDHSSIRVLPPLPLALLFLPLRRLSVQLPFPHRVLGLLALGLSYKVQIRTRLANLPLHRPLEPLLQLGHNENGRSERDEEHQIPSSECLRLEHHLQWWKVDDEQLPDQ